MQRNALLKQFYETHHFDRTLLELWDSRMEMPAQRIFEVRKTFAASFTPVFQNYYNMIAQSTETVEIEYESMLSSHSFQTIMQQAIEKDRVLHYTTAGIHKDNLVFKIGGYPVKYFGSQGQQKSFLIAMKLAQFEYIKEKLGVKPILLLDDVFDKLDDDRVNQLIGLTGSDCFGQVFITDTQRERIEQIFEKHTINHKIFTVEQGNIIDTSANNL
jgi:DNA replication and repair protein RecF